MADINDIKADGHYFIKRVGNTQALGAVTIAVPPLAYKHQITLGGFIGVVAAGTAAITVKPRGSSDFEAVQQGAIDFTAPLSLTFSGFVEAIKITPTLFDGTSYVITATGAP